MGGITRIFRSLPLVSKVIPKTPAAIAVDAMKTKPTTQPEPKAAPQEIKKPTFGGGTQTTILTSPKGVEDDPNVAKTLLGGSVKKPTNRSVGY